MEILMKPVAYTHSETIAKGAELLGWELDELLSKGLEAMKACEESININEVKVLKEEYDF